MSDEAKVTPLEAARAARKLAAEKRASSRVELPQGYVIVRADSLNWSLERNGKNLGYYGRIEYAAKGALQHLASDACAGDLQDLIDAVHCAGRLIAKACAKHCAACGAPGDDT